MGICSSGETLDSTPTFSEFGYALHPGEPFDTTSNDLIFGDISNDILFDPEPLYASTGPHFSSSATPDFNYFEPPGLFGDNPILNTPASPENGLIDTFNHDGRQILFPPSPSLHKFWLPLFDTFTHSSIDTLSFNPEGTPTSGTCKNTDPRTSVLLDMHAQLMRWSITVSTPNIENGIKLPSLNPTDQEMTKKHQPEVAKCSQR